VEHSFVTWAASQSAIRLLWQSSDCITVFMIDIVILLYSVNNMMMMIRGAPDPDPDPAGYLVNLVDPARIRIRPDPMYLDPAGSEVGSGKYWPHPHNYDIKHHSTLSFQEMTHDNTELSTKTH